MDLARHYNAQWRWISDIAHPESADLKNDEHPMHRTAYQDVQAYRRSGENDNQKRTNSFGTIEQTGRGPLGNDF